MKNKKKKNNESKLIYLVLAATVLLTSHASGSNDDNDKKEVSLENIPVMEVVYDEDERVLHNLDYHELYDKKEAKPIVKEIDTPIETSNAVVNDHEEESTSIKENVENYPLGYITCDTAVYNTILDKEEKIEAYQKVIILDKLEKVTLIKYINSDNEPMRGLVLNEMLNELPDTFVEIDISQQIVRLYVDNSLALESNVVTGMSYESPTPIGCFDIDEKKSPIFLKGYDGAGNVTYSRFVDYWMPFNGGIGLHDAEYHNDPEWGTYHGWRNPEDFGGNTYTYNGSHGCVNLLNAVAKEIYEQVEVGTKVLVHK